MITHVFSYSSDTLQVRMKAFSTRFLMSGCRAPWSITSPRTNLKHTHVAMLHCDRKVGLQCDSVMFVHRFVCGPPPPPRESSNFWAAQNFLLSLQDAGHARHTATTSCTYVFASDSLASNVLLPCDEVVPVSKPLKVIQPPPFSFSLSQLPQRLLRELGVSIASHCTDTENLRW